MDMLIPKGTILYHGTSADAKFFKLKGPAWFTTNFQLASIFAAEMSGSPGSKPRVYCYEVLKKLWLPELSQEEAAALEHELTGAFDGRYSAAAKKFCEDHFGWVIPKLYDRYGVEVASVETPSIDDIMICDMRVLKYIEQRAIDSRHYLDFIWLNKLRPKIQRSAGRPQQTLAGRIDRDNRMIEIIKDVLTMLDDNAI